jgi:DNA-binding LacI/PurR family transcriptional regulator
MRIRIKDIAAAAGVSPAAVSMALNSRPGIGEKTRQKILTIARSMKYDVERSSNLLHNKKTTIRFLYISRHGHVVNHEHEVFIANYIDGMSQAASKFSFALEISTILEGSIEEILKAAKSDRIGGVIVLGTEMSKDELKGLSSINVPMVIIDNYDEVLAYDFVDMNNKESVFTAVAHLVSRGHRKIGIVESYVAIPNFAMRAEAFREAMKYHDLELRREFCFRVDSTFEGAYRDMSGALDERPELPTALFCSNDIIAYGCIKALREKAIRIPEDVSVIGFDNLPSSAMMEPALTTIEVSKQQIGRLAVQLLNDRILARNSQPTSKILVSGQLIERESVRKII